jgi:hypothetical protein
VSTYFDVILHVPHLAFFEYRAVQFFLGRHPEINTGLPNDLANLLFLGYITYWLTGA